MCIASHLRDEICAFTARPRYLRGVKSLALGVLVVIGTAAAACGGGKGGGGGRGAPDGNNAGTPCSDALGVGQSCSITLAGSRTLTLALAAHQYVQFSAIASPQSALTLTGGYAGEQLRTTAEGSDLAFYNPSDAPLTAQIDLSGTASIAVTTQTLAFAPAVNCTPECGALIQLPLPREADAYRTISPTRYQ